MRSIKQAIILAGGKGERLRPYTNDRPKPMVEVAGKPIIIYQLDRLKGIGVENVVISCGYLWEVIKDYIKDGSGWGLEVDYSVETTPLGRGGGLKKAMGMFGDSWENIMAFNGDILSNVNLTELIAKHLVNQAVATLAVVPLKSPYGIIDSNGQDQIIGFREKPVLPFWVNAGMYVFSKDLEPLLPDIGDHETETFPKLPKEKFIVYKSWSYWRGVDTVKDLAEAEKEVKQIFG